MAVGSKNVRRGVPLSVRITSEIHHKLVARAEADNKSITQTVERVLDLGFHEEQRLGGPSLYSLFLAATDIARSQAYAAGLSEEDFLKAKWAKDPKLVDRIADNFAGLVRMFGE